MSTPVPDDVTSETKDLEYAHLRVTRLPGMENGFIRLVEAGTSSPANSYTAEEAHVDVDADGNVIGITWFARR